jgi:hypothetical protein
MKRNEVETWSDFKEYLSNMEVSLTQLFHLIVLSLLWVGVAYNAYYEEYTSAVAVAVIIIAWKMKDKQ